MGQETRSVVLDPADAVVMHSPVMASPMRIVPPRPEPDVTDHEFGEMTTALGLAGDQHELVMSLYTGYLAAFEQAADAARPERPIIRMNGGGGTFVGDADNPHQAHPETPEDIDRMISEMMKKEQVFQSTKRELLTGFHADVRALLDGDQATRWDPYHRAWTRRSTLTRKAALPREGIDLISLIENNESITEPQRAALAATFIQYDRDLFSALTARNELIEALDESHDFDAMELDEPESFMDDMDRLTQSRYAVMDVNLKYLDVVANQLPGELAAALRHDFNTKAYPRAFRSNRAETYLETIKDLDTLSDEQREQVAHIDRGYSESITRLQREFIEIETRHEAESRERITTRKSSTEDDGHGMIQIMGGMGDMIADSQVISDETREDRREWRTGRDELVSKTVDELHALLNPEQQTIAVKPEPRPQILFGNHGEMDTATLNAILEDALDGITLELDGMDGAVQVIAIDGGGGEIGVAVTVSPPANEGEDGDDK